MKDALVFTVLDPDDPITAEALAPFNVDSWQEWRKHAVTRAIRVTGPFTVGTSEGPLKCEDGYLAVDARGYPYPIAADEFDLIYAPADEKPPVTVDDVAEKLTALDGAVSFTVAHRSGEWSAAVVWNEQPALFTAGGVKPSTAHANGETLEQATTMVLDDAARIHEANQE